MKSRTPLPNVGNVLASILTFTQTAGYPLLFVLVTAESGGIPLPGETALIAAAALAASGKLSIPAVIAVAAVAAIVGDNLGYMLARKYGRGLLLRPGPLARQRRHVLEFGEPFFARHGPKAVFLGRWILGLRTWAAWLAGASEMKWRSFALWNAIGGIMWAATVGLAGYLIGQSTAGVFALFGFVGLGATVSTAGVLFARRVRRHPGSEQLSRRHARLQVPDSWRYTRRNHS